MTIDKPTAAHQRQLRALWQEAFQDDAAYLDIFFSTAFSPSRCLCAAEEGKVVSAVYWLDCWCRGKKLAYIYALATAKAYQGRGIARALMAEVHSRLALLGYAGTLLVPGEPSLFALYETMGYRTCTQVREFVCSGAAEEVQLYRMDPEEYARQRRDLLSLLEEGGVLQEDVSLELLAAQADFYGGQNFLLAGRAQGDTLVGLELLGDPQKAPGILQALGFAQGSFRTRGSGKDFAMFRPLVADAPTPTYFGLAFD